MAELAIKIDDGSGYEDGDVLCAFSRRRIRCCHAEHICHVRQAPRNASGLIVLSSLARHWFEETHLYRFERVSATEIKRINLLTKVEERFSDKPNARGEAMDVRLFIARRKQQPQHYLFGEDGAEIWYGGAIDLSHPKLDKVWNAIETKSALREADHALWPAGEQDLKSHLFLPVLDMTESVVADLEGSEPDEADPEKVSQKRKHKCDWSAKLSLTSDQRQDIRDKSKAVDLRQSLPALNVLTLAEVKPKKPKNPTIDKKE